MTTATEEPATQKWTKAAVVKLVRQKHGSTAGVGENRQALSEEGKQPLRDRAQIIRDTMKDIEARRKEIEPGLLRKLTDAAQFVVDVDAQQPSLSQLAAATAVAQESLALSKEARELRDEGSQLTGRLLQYRCEAFVDRTWCRHVLAQADSWEELAEKLERKP